MNPPDKELLEILLEAARRANWDAQHGPRHLRTGRFTPVAMEEDGVISPVMEDDLDEAFLATLPVVRKGQVLLLAHGRSWLDEAAVYHTIHLVLTTAGEDIRELRGSAIPATLEVALRDALGKLAR